MHLFSDPVSILEPDVLQSPNKLFQQSFNERIAWQPHSTYMPINEISSMLPNPEPRAFLVASGLTVQLSERCIGFETNLEHTPIKITYCIFTGTWHFQLDPKDDRMSLALLWLGVSVRFRCHKSLTTWQRDTRKKMRGKNCSVAKNDLSFKNFSRSWRDAVELCARLCPFHEHRVPATCIRYTCLWHIRKKCRCFPSNIFFHFFFCLGTMTRHQCVCELAFNVA